MEQQLEIKYTLGFAGSGKSTLLASETSKLTKDKYLVLTPTHKAKNVLLDKGVVNVFTIHSVLKLVPTLNQNFRGKLKHKLSRVGDVDLSKITHIFLDEFSMIPQHVFDILTGILDESTKNCVLSIYGDPYQLPPVDGQAIVPVGDITTLTTQHRSNAKEVVDAFMRFKYYIAGEPVDTLVVEVNGDDIMPADDWLTDFNPDTDRILAYTNDRVQELNNIVANYTYGTTALQHSEKLLLGALDVTYLSTSAFSLVDLFPVCISKNELTDDYMTRAQNKRDDLDKYNSIPDYPTCDIEYNGNLFTVYYDMDYHKTIKHLTKEVEKYQNSVIFANNLDKDVDLAKWCKSNYNAEYVRERGKAWGNYLTYTSSVFPLARGYATTVHKAQGSEFSSVFIDQDNIKKAISGRYLKQYARLMYVAMSRAMNRVYIIK